jgi:hypothetical protein
MKKLSVILALIVSVLMISNSCTKKDLKITLKEDGCAKFKIYGASYTTLADPTCGGSPLTASYKVTFQYTGDIKCLTTIYLDPQFLTSTNGNLSATYNSQISTSGNPQVTIDENAKTCTFQFDFTFANSSIADSYDHCYLVFHTENSQGESSKNAQVRMFGTCSVMAPGGYDPTPKGTVHVTSSTIYLRLWDDAAEDGDVVSVYLDGVLVINNHMLTNAGNTFPLTVTSGNNDLVLVAMNQGSSGPNTCALSVNSGTTYSLTLDLKTGQMIRITF